jgi:hypothetical protein
MDHTFGHDGWSIIHFGADHQYGEQANLYRTLYVRFVHPRFKRYTPWRDLQFTHKTTCIYRPWHYWINVVTPEREITYYWSMRGNGWEKAWDNSLDHYKHWPERREEYTCQLAHKERRSGMNFSQPRIEQGAEGDAVNRTP